MKIGIIIPSTSNGRNWISYKESYLFKHTLKTFLLTYNNEHEYIFTNQSWKIPKVPQAVTFPRIGSALMAEEKNCKQILGMRVKNVKDDRFGTIVNMRIAGSSEMENEIDSFANSDLLLFH